MNVHSHTVTLPCHYLGIAYQKALPSSPKDPIFMSTKGGFRTITVERLTTHHTAMMMVMKP